MQFVDVEQASLWSEKEFESRATVYKGKGRAGCQGANLTQNARLEMDRWLVFISDPFQASVAVSA